MRVRRSAGALSAVLVSALALSPGAGAVAAPAPGGGPAGGGGTTTKPRTVTLITGDRVVVYGPNRFDVERGKGREGVTFAMRSVRGHAQVIPADAAPMMRAGQVDPRLFDVTALLEFGYDRRDHLPLIVTRRDARTTARPRVPGAARIVRDLPGARGVAARIDRAATGSFWRDLTAHRSAAGAPKVWLDGLRKPSLERSVPQVGAPAAWEAGFTGEGVTVAVVDTGIDAAHPDLAGKVAAERNFVEGEDGLDRVGHGTHVASTVAGTGAASGGRNKGVAPGARLVSAKVCGAEGCPESSILAGMEWAAAEQHARVVNMSLGGGDEPGVDPLEQAVQDLTARHGTLFVSSAGNSGADGTVGSPASADAALAVGAVNRADGLASFSSRGPRVGDFAVKPDITAPGDSIVAARSKDSDRPGESYTTLSGTSMSSPHVAGAAAILAQRRPDWTPAQLKAALMASAAPNPALGVFAQGAGRLDVARAVNQTLVTTPPSVSMGRQLWPHADDALITRTVSYRNTGNAAVTVTLALQASGPGGTPAPAGMFAISESTLTVPAGGAADVVVTADTRVSGPDGVSGGYLVATANGAVTRTPFAVDKEVESYDVVLAHRNRAGQSTHDYLTGIINVDSGAFVDGYDPDGTVEARLPRGRYSISSLIFDGDLTTSMFTPVLDVRGERRVDIDARTARPMSAKLPAAGLTQFFALALFAIPELGGAWVGVNGESFDTLFVGAIGDPLVAGALTKVDGKWAKPGPDGSLDESRSAYNLTWTVRDRIPVGFERVVRERDLATVRANYLPGIPGGVASSRAGGWAEGVEFASGAPLTFHPPLSRTEYYGGTPDVRWDVDLTQRREDAPDDEPVATTAVQLGTSYRAGRGYTETWNRGVFGPAMPGGYDPARTGWGVRLNDTIFTQLPLFGDGSGRAGLSTGRGSVRLLRDGTPIDEVETFDTAEFTVPAEPGRYRLEATVARGAPFTLSTRVSAAWEFDSRRPPADQLAPLALSAVRFTPRLDEHNTAPAGRDFTVPVSTQAQLGSPAAPTRSLAVEASFNDGATWSAVDLRSDGAGWTATVRHPAGEHFVSLRARATDRAGNTMTQTIIRAYRIA